MVESVFERNVDKIISAKAPEFDRQLLAFVDRHDPPDVLEASLRPGAFLYRMYRSWQSLAAGHGIPTRTFRGMRNELIKRNLEVRSLQKKLHGDITISKEEAKRLIRLMLETWEITELENGESKERSITISKENDINENKKLIDIVISNLLRCMYQRKEKIRIEKPIGEMPEIFFEERGKSSLALILPTKPLTVTSLSPVNAYAGFSELLTKFFSSWQSCNKFNKHPPLLIWVLRLPNIRGNSEFHESFYTLAIYESALANWFFRLKWSSQDGDTEKIKLWNEIFSRSAFVIHGLPEWYRKDNPERRITDQIDNNLSYLEENFFLPVTLPTDFNKHVHGKELPTEQFGLTVTIEAEDLSKDLLEERNVQYWLFPEKEDVPETAETTGLPVFNAERSPGEDYDLAYDAIYKAVSVKLGLDLSADFQRAYNTLYTKRWTVLRINELQHALRIEAEL